VFSGLCRIYRIRYFIINLLIMQVTSVRPFLWFIAAVLWTNNAYYAGLVIIIIQATSIY